MPLDTLMGGLKAAHLDTGEPICPGTPGAWPADAGIIPAVLGGKSQVLDLGRKNRFGSEAQRIAQDHRSEVAAKPKAASPHPARATCTTTGAGRRRPDQPRRPDHDLPPAPLPSPRPALRHDHTSHRQVHLHRRT